MSCLKYPSPILNPWNLTSTLKWEGGPTAGSSSKRPGNSWWGGVTRFAQLTDTTQFISTSRAQWQLELAGWGHTSRQRIGSRCQDISICVVIGPIVTLRFLWTFSYSFSYPSLKCIRHFVPLSLPLFPLTTYDSQSQQSRRNKTITLLLYQRTTIL